MKKTENTKYIQSCILNTNTKYLIEKVFEIQNTNTSKVFKILVIKILYNTEYYSITNIETINLCNSGAAIKCSIQFVDHNILPINHVTLSFVNFFRYTLSGIPTQTCRLFPK